MGKLDRPCSLNDTIHTQGQTSQTRPQPNGGRIFNAVKSIGFHSNAMYINNMIGRYDNNKTILCSRYGDGDEMTKYLMNMKT